ncbi:MAG TPA: SulP family inorganic anion transporter, partial [Myxococcaceae bacterium]|nr:SulP family inorganic anion transporter [Myxococcaceae bacterium]
ELLLGLGRAGKLIRYLPESVLVGFTTGVGIKLLDQQIPELLGFDYKVYELTQMLHRPAWLREVSWFAVLSGLFVAFLVVGLRHFKRFPAALVGIAIVTAISDYVGWDVARVGSVPSSLPSPHLPALDSAQWLSLMVKVLPLAILAAAESLIAARAIQRMAPHVPEPNLDLELTGQGFANLATGFFSGMPVTGVIVRSGVNVQSGAKTRLSALIHSSVLLFAVLFLSESLALIPLAGLAGLLCVVGFRLVEVRTLVHLWREDRLGAVAFVVTAAGTVSGYLVQGMVAGLVIALLGHRLRRPRRAAQEAAREATALQRQQGVRAVLDRDRAEARRPTPYESRPQSLSWLRNIRERAEQAASAFVHPQSSVVGRVVMGEHVHIAAGSSVRADEGSPFFIGDNTNLQDGVVVHALKNKKVKVGGESWAVYVGRNVSVAHNALLHGPCYIGDDTFVGFKAVVHDSVVGAHCYIGIGAVVVGVEIPDGKFVPHGSIVDSADAVDRLPPASEAHHEFNEDVVDVNRGLADAYHANAGTGRATGLALTNGGARPRPLPPARRKDVERF